MIDIDNIKIKFNHYSNYLLVIGVMVSVGISILALIYAKQQPKFSKVALNGITDSYVKHLAETEIDPELRKKIINKFSKILEQEVNFLAKEQQGIVLVEEAVIAGGIDLTPTLATRIKEKIHEQTK
jgi:hypothetical protein